MSRSSDIVKFERNKYSKYASDKVKNKVKKAYSLKSKLTVRGPGLLKRNVQVAGISEKPSSAVENRKVMVDANVDTVDLEMYPTVNGDSQTTRSVRESSPTDDQTSDVPTVETNQENDMDLQDSAAAQQLLTQSNIQLPLLNQHISNELANGNGPMANLDFGTSSTSIYYPSTSCSMYPATSSYQCSPSKSLVGFNPGLTFQSSLRGTSLNYMPYALPDNVLLQNNNNFGDVGNSGQQTRQNDLLEKSLFELKEQSILLRRLLDGQEVMIGHLSKIFQGITEATQADDSGYSVSLQMADNNRTTVQSSVNHIPASCVLPAHSESQGLPVSDHNGMDLSVHSQYT